MSRRKTVKRRIRDTTAGPDAVARGSDLSLMGYLLHMADTAVSPGIRRVYQWFAAGERQRLGKPAWPWPRRAGSRD